MTLADRMKDYEQSFYTKLPNRMPVIIRLDGRAFHSLLANAEKPFSNNFIWAMQNTMAKLTSEIDTARFAYNQSDEISILLVNYNKFESQAWFNNEVQKLVSISASLATYWFGRYFGFLKRGLFDSRVFVLPANDVENYFIWRQKDWMRNSVMMFARKYFSQKQLQNVSVQNTLKMLADIKADYESYNNVIKYGSYAIDGAYYAAPMFSENRNLFVEALKIEDE